MPTSRIIDIGPGGCFIASPVLPRVGEEVEIWLTLENADAPAGFVGRAAYTLGRLGFGVQFVHSNDRAQEQLGEWLLEHARFD